MTKRKVVTPKKEVVTAYIAVGWYDGQIIGKVAGKKGEAVEDYECNFDRKHIELFSIEMLKDQDDEVVELKRV